LPIVRYSSSQHFLISSKLPFLKNSRSGGACNSARCYDERNERTAGSFATFTNGRIQAVVIFNGIHQLA
jgi:hypothetical protein